MEWDGIQAIAGLADKKRSCRAGSEKKGMYKEKTERDVPVEVEEEEEVRIFFFFFRLPLVGS